MKANHNTGKGGDVIDFVVLNILKEQNESKSQHTP